MNLSRRELIATAIAGTAGTLTFARDARLRKLVLIAGTPSHPPGMHEFNAGVRLLNQCLASVNGLKTEVCLNGFPRDTSVFEGADAILCFADGGAGHPLIRENRLKFIDSLMQRGVGLMCAHFGVEVPRDIGAEEFRRWIGGCYEHQFSCNPIWKPEFQSFPDHPVTRGVKPFSISDEWYFNMRFRPDMKGVTPLLSAVPPDSVRDGPYVYPRGPYAHIQAAKGKNQSEHMMWCVEREDGGRGVGFTGGHVHRNWLDPNFRKVVLNALLWISKVEVPANGVESSVSEVEIAQNLDPKKK